MKNNKLIIRLAHKKEKKKIQNFLNFNFKKNHILTRNQKLFKWLYVGKKINCCLALKNKKILGIYFFIPLEHFDKKLSKNKHHFGSLWTVESFNKEKSKNSNIKNIYVALKIFKETFRLIKTKFDIAVGLDERFYRFHKSQKYQEIGKLNHHYLVSPYIKKTKILDNSKVTRKYDSINQINLGIKFNKISSSKNIKKLKINKLFKYQIPFKSKDYLINRYLKHPIYKYHIYHIGKGKLMSLCVFRIIKIKKINIIRIVDYVGANQSFKYLKIFFYAILKKYKSEYLDFYSFGIPLETLKKAGLENRMKNKKLTIPNYFEPFLNKNIDISVGYRKNNKVKGNVRIFKGDGDQDRPNI